MDYGMYQKVGVFTSLTQCNFRLGIPQNTQSKLHICIYALIDKEYQNNALWDTLKYTL